MKTWICTTLSSFFGPMQGAARLYAYIKEQGHDVSLKDFNQNAYFKLLSKEYLQQTAAKLEYMLEPAIRTLFVRKNIGSILLNNSGGALKQLLSKGFLLHSRWYQSIQKIEIADKVIHSVADYKINNLNIFYALLSEKDFVIEEVEKAKEIIDKNFFKLSPHNFLLYFQTLLCGKALIDAVHFPAQLDFGFGFHGTAFSPCAADITLAVEDERRNFLIPYFRNEVMPLLEKEQPDIVGISVTHTSDFIPAFTLAHLIKSLHPEIHICLGGSTITAVAHRVCKNPTLWNNFDSLVLGPGESAFSELIEHLEGKSALSVVPNLIYKENGSIKKSEKVYEFDINDACTPDYGFLRPKSGIPLETSSGCYWGKCIFCYYPKEGTAGLDPEINKKRVRKIELVLEDMRKLKERHDPIYIGITDSSLHPGRIEQIAEQNINNGKIVHFSAFVRFEKEFRSLSFCQKLAKGGFLGGQIGLESGSQRVNNIINKGVELDDAASVLRNFHKSGILIHLYTVIGIPGETKSDSVMTYNFIKRRRRILTLNWQIFSLYVVENGPLAERANEFGLETSALPDEFLVPIMEYEVKDGLSQEEGIALSIDFYEKLKYFMHPLHKIMDIESQKLFFLAQGAKGIMPDRIKL